MKTASVRDLRNHCSQLLSDLEAGEEIVITRRGKSIARLVPESPNTEARIDWKQSPAVTRKRTTHGSFSSTKDSSVIHDAASQW